MPSRLAVPALLVAAALAVPSSASAIPAFARKYRVSCTTCHTVFPHLKPYGEEYAGRGFRLAEGAPEPARSTIDTGDPLLALPRDLPLALRFDAFAAWQDRRPQLDLQPPWVLKLLSGGPIADVVSYYAYFIVEEGEVAGFEDAYLHFSSPFGLPFDLLAGQFQVSDPIFKRELRLERFDYEILRVRVGESRVNLTYDRGLAAAFGGRGFDVVLQVVNGNGIGGAADGRFDSDPWKNPSLRVAAEAGPLRVGGFGYWGRERRGGLANDVFYVGPDAMFALGERWQLSGLWLLRHDSNPSFVPGGGDAVTQGGFAELLHFPRGWNGRAALALLYNRVLSDVADARRHSVAAHACWLLRRNVRLAAEVGRDVHAGAWTASAGTSAAF